MKSIRMMLALVLCPGLVWAQQEPEARAIEGAVIGGIIGRPLEDEQDEDAERGALVGAAVGGLLGAAAGEVAGAVVGVAQIEQARLLAELVGTEWRLTRIGDKESAKGVETTLSFFEENRVAGKAGVNRFNGALLVAEGKLKAGPFMTTRMAGPKDAMDQEFAFLSALERADKVSVVDGMLVIACAGCGCSCDGDCAEGCGKCGGECKCEGGCKPPVDLVFAKVE